MDAKVHALPPWLEAVQGLAIYAWAIRGWNIAAAIPGNWFDHALADSVVQLWPTLFCHTEGEWAGKPFVLARWQEIVVRLLIGWRDACGYRHFRRLLLWVARKNGKSEFMAALALLFWICDGEIGGKGYCFARNEKQAAIVFDKMKTMLRMSPALRKDVTPKKRELWHAHLAAKFELLSGQAEGKHGLSASVIVGDEAHECPDDVLYTTLHQSTAARTQPVELIGSTAGHKNRGWGWKLWEECQAILEGRLKQPRDLVVIFAAPADARIDDEAAWSAANPNLGVSPRLDYLRDECAKALENPRLENDFRRYHLNQWTEQVTRWIPLAKWDANKGAVNWRDLRAKLKGRTCFGGLDLSSTRDITALVWLFPPAEGEQHWIIAPRFFVPADTIEERSRNDRVHYDEWARNGALETTPGNVVDQDAIFEAVMQGGRDFDVQQFGYDSWNATQLALRLQDEGVPVIEIRQGIPSLGEPSKEFERLIYGGAFAHGGHPVLRWMVGNVAVEIDSNGNFKPSKKKSSEKIDGVVATIMALRLAIGRDEAPAKSPWDDPNFTLNPKTDD
ncbi:MAG: terminase large subunit [Alphaproteobacteria bacterium]|nr:terminase large subunit [Alphaproteobacteria bacterium]